MKLCTRCPRFPCKEVKRRAHARSADWHGALAPYTTKPPRNFPAAKPPFNRIAYAAAHVVADPLADGDPWLDAAIDWERTIAFRRHLWSLGLGVAEAMDTAQRGMGMDWPASLELIRQQPRRRAGFSRRAASAAAPAPIISKPGAGVTIDDVIARLRGAVRGGREARRTHRADGEPGAGEGGALAATTTPRSMAASSAR